VRHLLEADFAHGLANDVKCSPTSNTPKMVLTTMRMKRLTIIILITISLTLAGGRPAIQAANTAAAPAPSAKRFVSIDFNDVDIGVFIKFISELTGKNFVIDRRVKGKVTIISPSKITVDEAFKVFESVLEVHGYTTVKAGNVIKIVPSPDARTKNIETIIGRETGDPEDKLVTQLIPLKYAEANEIKRLLTPMVSKSSVILAYPTTNTIIITDIYSNIKRLLSIINQIDSPGVGQKISVVPVEYADASKLVKLIDSIFSQQRDRKKGTVQKAIKLVADERTNTAIILASEVDTLRIRQLIRMLDQQTPKGKGNIHVYFLQNATAEDLAKVLTELPSRETTAKGAPGKRTRPVLSEKVRITADKATNSLVIVADKEDYQVIEGIIRQLDIPRSMVYLESLIMEVNVKANFNVGVDWSGAFKTDVFGKDAVAGGAFSPAEGILNEQALAQDGGLTLGIITEAIEIVTDAGTISLPNLAAVADLLKTDEDFRILSTPQLLTTDNEEASIIVAENIPFQTQSTTTDVNTFNSFEYRDVGITMKITPHITVDRKVRLKIFLEQSSETGVTITEEGANQTLPRTLKRNFETTAIIDDKNTIVIGGLIEDTSTDNQTYVPCLGDVPGLRWLFRSSQQQNRKTNLFVFVSPRVVKGPDEIADISKSKRNRIDRIREGDVLMYDGTPDTPQEQPLSPGSIPGTSGVQ
jgi:general secretion pathway protein D